jgi:hypothetical protein
MWMMQQDHQIFPMKPEPQIHHQLVLRTEFQTIPPVLQIQKGLGRVL